MHPLSSPMVVLLFFEETMNCNYLTQWHPKQCQRIADSTYGHNLFFILIATTNAIITASRTTSPEERPTITPTNELCCDGVVPNFALLVCWSGLCVSLEVVVRVCLCVIGKAFAVVEVVCVTPAATLDLIVDKVGLLETIWLVLNVGVFVVRLFKPMEKRSTCKETFSTPNWNLFMLLHQISMTI